jgi:hypothetical protein
MTRARPSAWQHPWQHPHRLSVRIVPRDHTIGRLACRAFWLDAGPGRPARPGCLPSHGPAGLVCAATRQGASVAWVSASSCLSRGRSSGSTVSATAVSVARRRCSRSPRAGDPACRVITLMHQALEAHLGSRRVSRVMHGSIIGPALVLAPAGERHLDRTAAAQRGAEYGAASIASTARIGNSAAISAGCGRGRCLVV